ncbi:MAG: dockerin type I repeat-containing protein [Ruminococcus sp.]|nr:dockerin type I repeat-containing protein [Ruminococcus sp.]
MKRIIAIILALVMLFGCAVTAHAAPKTDKAARTMMMNVCGADPESGIGMAAYNLKQILGAAFSRDENVRFTIMTGGSKTWHMDSELPYDPATGEAPDGVSTEYNQIREAFGADEENEDYRGKTVLVDGDGISGDADGDGKVTVLDAACIQKNLANIETSSFNENAADVDRDGKVTILDATNIQKYLASLPCSDGIGEPIKKEMEHKLVSRLQAFRWNYDAQDWDISYTSTFEYENAYPVLIDTLESYEGAEHTQKTFEYTFDGDLPLTSTITDTAQSTVTTTEYKNGKVYNRRLDSIGSTSWMTEKYQYGHDDDYFTLVLHEGFVDNLGYMPNEWKEEADSISVTTENGLLKQSVNTGIYAKWLEGEEKEWIRFRGVYTINYDADGIASLRTANYSDIGYDPQYRYEVVKKNGKITEIIKYNYNTYEGGWIAAEKYLFDYTDIEISPARYSLMINDFITEHGGNYYLFNWY